MRPVRPPRARGSPSTCARSPTGCHCGWGRWPTTALGEAIEGGKTRIVVDLEETTFLDSTALGVLIGTVKRLRSRDGRMTIVNVDPNIAKTFEITGLDQIFTIRATREEAVAA